MNTENLPPQVSDLISKLLYGKDKPLVKENYFATLVNIRDVIDHSLKEYNNQLSQWSNLGKRK